MKFEALPGAFIPRYPQITLRDTDKGPVLVANGLCQDVSVITEGRKCLPPFTVAIRPLDLLLSWLELVQEPLDPAQLDRCVPPAQAVAWCERYGLPQVDSVGTLGGLPLRTFQDEVLTLYRLSMLWIACQAEDQERFDGLWVGGLPHMTECPVVLVNQFGEEYGSMTIRQHIADGLARTPSWAKRLHFYSSTLLGCLRQQYQHCHVFLGELGKPAITADRNVFVVGYVILDALRQLPPGTLPERALTYKSCANSLCSNKFWGHGNAKYCRECDRRTILSRNKRGSEQIPDTHDKIPLFLTRPPERGDTVISCSETEI